MTTDHERLNQIESLKDDILANYPRLNKDDKFRFACHKGLKCFGSCCGDVNIFLTPYDVVRLKNRLGISSEEFIAKHAMSPPVEYTRVPVLVLKMQDNEKKSCPFVSEDGVCTVYEDRPTSCRMYPVGQASGKTGENPEGTEFFFLMQDDKCMGINEDKEWSIAEWMNDQGVDLYDQMNLEFKEINLSPYFKKEKLPPEKLQMYYMASYNLDMFRRFLFESRFFEIFIVDEETKKAIEKDDVELLKFAFKWLRFSLFGHKTLEIKEEVLEKKSRQMFKDAIIEGMPK